MSDFERITAIDRALQDGGVSAAAIARRYEVDLRGFRRDNEYVPPLSLGPVPRRSRSLRFPGAALNLKP